jgi:hypothetical protein
VLVDVPGGGGGRREGGRQGCLVVSRAHGQSEYRRIRIEEVSLRVVEEEMSGGMSGEGD